MSKGNCMMSKKGEKEITPCSVCDVSDGRYKCPQCRLAYCSVGCCKTHKQSCGQKQTDTETETAVADSSSAKAHVSALIPPSTATIDVFDSNDLAIITDLQKKQLSDCKEIRDILKSKRLRDKISEIDCSGNTRRTALKNARSNPEFEEFLDLMLRTIKYKEEEKGEKVKDETSSR
jgi:hypothetical protein